MARARNIKPSFFTNEVLGTLDPIICLLFSGLWCLADKEGILEDRPLRIKAELFPYRDGLDINGYLTVLERHEFIVRYVVDGKGYIQVVNFDKHQHPHHTEKPKGFPKPQAKQSLTPLDNGCTPSDSLIPDSLIPDSVNIPSECKAAPVKFSASAYLDGKGVSAQVATDWLALRKSKKAPVTETAVLGIEREASKAMLTLEDALRCCCQNGWQGFKAEWVTKGASNGKQSRLEQLQQCADELTGRNRGGARTFDGYATSVD